MSRTANTEGTVCETPKGSGWYRAMLPARLCPTGQRKYIDGRWHTKTDARRALGKAIGDIEEGRRTAPSRRRGEPAHRVRHAVEEYIDYRENNATAPLSIHTVRAYRSDLKNHISNPTSALGNTPIEKVTPLGVHQWMDDLARAGVSPGTTETAKRLLDAALNRDRHREHHHIGHRQQVRQVGGGVDTDARRAAHHHDLGLERLQPAAAGLPDSARPIRSGTLSHP